MTTDRPRLRALVAELVDQGTVAGAQMRVRDGQGEWTGSAGVRALDDPAPPATDGRFRTGSTTKTFTAAVVLLLVADGALELDGPALPHLPGYDLDPRITVRMLLQHTSGVFNHTGEYGADGFTPGVVTGLGPGWAENRHRSFDPGELARAALVLPARFEPGRGWSYSNTNYVLARLLVEGVTGRPFPEEVRRRVLEPLGLTGTSLPETSPEIPEPHAHGYYRYEDDGGQWRTLDTTSFDPSWISAAGDVISTTADLQTFVSALMGGRLLPAHLVAEMCAPDPTMGYGLGLFVERTPCGTTVVHHNGNFWGWATLMISSLDGATTVTASLTSGDTDLDLATMSGRFEAFKQAVVAEVFCG